MSSLKLYGSTSGYVEIVPEATAGNNSVTLPNGSGTLVVADGSGNVNVSGIITATSFSGDGSALTGVSFSIGAGSTSAPSLSPTGDSNTGIFFPAADTIAFGEGGAEAMRIDSSGRVAIARNDAGTNLHVGPENGVIRVGGNVAGGSGLDIDYSNSGNTTTTLLTNYRSSSNGARLKLDSGYITFHTGTLAGDETARISNTRQHLVGTTDTSYNGKFVVSSDQASQPGIDSRSSNAAIVSQTVLRVVTGSNTVIGSITHNSLNTAFNTSSDYRLKENVVPLTGAIDRLNQLKVCRFNFIADPDTTMDGFLAHEAQEVVPECATGVKDEVEVWKEGQELPDGVSVGDNKLDEDGNTIPVHQGIDQSKLVPLLTAALQETIAELNALKAEVAALKNP
jgi:hypothetical protein